MSQDRWHSMCVPCPDGEALLSHGLEVHFAEDGPVFGGGVDAEPESGDRAPVRVDDALGQAVGVETAEDDEAVARPLEIGWDQPVLVLVHADLDRRVQKLITWVLGVARHEP